jgi:hypothetical protein
MLIEGNIPGDCHAAGLHGQDLQQPVSFELHQENTLEAADCKHPGYNTFM